MTIRSFFIEGVQVGVEIISPSPPPISTMSFTISPSVVPNNSQIVLTANGVSTNWDSSTVFLVEGKMSQQVFSPTSAEITVNTGLPSNLVVTVDGLEYSIQIEGVGVIPVNSSSIYWSPWNWYNNGVYALSINPGSYFILKLTCESGGSLSAIFDTGNLGGASQKLLVSVNDGNYSEITVDLNSTEVELVSNLPAGTHRIQVWYSAADIGTGGRWEPGLPGGSQNYVKITSLSIQPTSYISFPNIQPKTVLVYGDSISEGAFLDGAKQNPLKSWVPMVADVLGAEYGLIGFSSQGYNSNGYGPVPNFFNTWSYYYSSQSRLINGLLNPEPDFIIVAHGTNGTTSIVDVETMLSNLRTASPNSTIIHLVQPSISNHGLQQTRDNIISAVSNSLDSNVFLVDNLGGIGVDRFYLDPYHPNQSGHGHYASIVSYGLKGVGI